MTSWCDSSVRWFESHEPENRKTRSPKDLREDLQIVGSKICPDLSNSARETSPTWGARLAPLASSRTSSMRSGSGLPRKGGDFSTGVLGFFTSAPTDVHLPIEEIPVLSPRVCLPSRSATYGGFVDKCSGNSFIVLRFDA